MSVSFGDFKKLAKLANLGSSGGSSTPSGQTVRNIATRCRNNYQTFATAARGIRSRTYHINMGDDIQSSDGIQVVVANWLANNIGETATSVTSTEYISIEYPIGIFTIATWSNVTGVASSQSAPCPGGQEIKTDFIKVAIPKGAGFFVNHIATYPSAINPPVSSTGTTSLAEPAVSYYWTDAQLTALTTDIRAFLTGTTLSGGQTTGGAFAQFPVAILGKSSVPSVIIYGDSRASGRSDGTAATAACDFGYWGIGEIARSIGHALPYTNFGCETDTIQNFNAQHTFRARIAQYHQYVHFEYGINDLTAGRTAAVISAALASAYALFPSQKVSQSTIPPVTTSTDVWVTTANQTVVASNPQRTALNDIIRTKPAPLWNYFEIADVFETSRNSGIWNILNGQALTGDGTHETPIGYQLIQTSGAINTALFT